MKKRLVTKPARARRDLVQSGCHPACLLDASGNTLGDGKKKKIVVAKHDDRPDLADS